MNANRFIAHVKQTSTGEWQEHALDDHLRVVGDLAAKHADCFGARDWAKLAGLWHDLGKYSAEFQGYIRSASGYDRPEAHIEGVRGRVNHSTAGAIHACDKLGSAGRALAYLIAGHHAGLPDWHGDQNAAASLAHRLSDRKHVEVLLLTDIPEGVLEPGLRPAGKIPGGPAGAHLWLRMLFSSLVDADFLDTEAFMETDKASLRSGYPPLDALLKCFDTHMTRFDGSQLTPVNRVRAEVLRQCREKASLAPGIFTLTVPTGGGKTLASTAFALNHAECHGKRRVIYAIPYTSIIEQTAGIYHEIFGDNVIEHHSALDSDKETAKNRLAAENWDAPLIVTTSVQLFESLFSARTSRCRKLHNLVDSVIVLDEVQLLPPELLQPVLDVMNLLVAHYRVTIVLCTATQPALEEVKSFGRELRGLAGVQEIMDNPEALYKALERVKIVLPEDFHARRSWDEVAEVISTHDRVLAIVNSRPDCSELWHRMPDGTIYLSAAMCGAHRSQVIARIKKCLADGESLRVVSTQLVEAGVDLDFPVVYRALAGLDSIAQAAGRCNREGKIDRGQTVVFVPPRSAPPGQLRRAEQATISVLAGSNADPMSRSIFTRYFKQFYLAAPSWDAFSITDLLVRDASHLEIQFRTAAEQFRFIDDADTLPVLVWWGDDSRALIGKLEKDGPARWLMRKLQRYSVNLSRRVVERLLQTREVREVWPGIYAQAVDTLYDTDLGVVADSKINAEQLVM